MTEKTIAEIRETVTCFMGAGNDTEYDRALNTLKENAGEWIPFLLSELDREREEKAELQKEWNIYKSSSEVFYARLQYAQQEIERYKQFEQQYNEFKESWEKYQQDKEKLIEGLRWYADEKNYRREFHSRHGTLVEPADAIYYDCGQRARDILKEIGVTVE